MSELLHSGKKRKIRVIKEEPEEDHQPFVDDVVSSSSNIKLETLNDTTIHPPDNSELSPVIRLLSVDLLQDDADAVRKALHQLTDLTANQHAGGAENNEQQQHRAVFHRVGGTTILAGIMKKWYAFPEIQALGCLTLKRAVAEKDEYKQSAIDTGALHAIVWAMGNYADDLFLQTQACGSLGNFVMLRANADCIVRKLKGVELVVAAMKKFKENAYLLLHACRFLSNLLLSFPDMKDMVKEAGCVLLLAEAIETHKNENEEHVKDVQKYAQKVLHIVFSS